MARRTKTIVAACVVALAALGGGIAAVVTGGSSPPRHAQAARSTPPATTPHRQRATPRGRPTSHRRGAARPRQRLARGHHPASGPSLARIKIPAIGVDAPVIRLGLNSDHTLQVPARTDVTGWWSGGAIPGRRGAAVIVGHVDSKVGPAVFFRLRDLRPGDRIRVIPRGRPAVTFTAQRSIEAPKDHFPTREVYAPTRRPTLRLVTCTGTFNQASGHYRDNLIVFARRG